MPKAVAAGYRDVTANPAVFWLSFDT